MLLKMSISGGILIIFVIILRHLLNRRLPKRVFMLLWDIVILRLLIPFDLPMEYGISLPLLQTARKNPVNPAHHIISSAAGSLPLQTGTAGMPVTEAKTFNISTPVLIWITGTVVLTIIFALLYLKEYHILREAIPVTKEQENNLRQAAKIPGRIKLMASDRISTPLVYGIIHPGIIFPRLFKTDNQLFLEYIITHELVHIKRADNLWKILSAACVCIHWFNPLAWVMYILSDRDLEISCDEKVISIFGSSARKDYALALINFAENQYNLRLFSNGFGKKPVQERIEAIMGYKKLTIPGAICAAILLGTAVTVFAKGPAPEDKGNMAVQKNISKMENLIKENPAGATPSAIYHYYDGSDNDFNYFAHTEEFKEYEKYGLSYNEKTGHLMYNGKIVGYFHDETSKDVFTHLTDKAGETGIKVKRNSDNVITGFEEVEIPYIMEPDDITEKNAVVITIAEDDAIEKNALEDNFSLGNSNSTEEDVAYTISNFSTTSDDSSASSEDNGDNSTLLEDYKKYGITYNKSLDMWQYNGKDIAGFWDKDKMLYTNGDTRKDSVYLVINNGSIKEVTKKEFSKIFEE